MEEPKQTRNHTHTERQKRAREACENVLQLLFSDVIHFTRSRSESALFATHLSRASAAGVCFKFVALKDFSLSQVNNDGNKHLIPFSVSFIRYCDYTRWDICKR
jgi:hypothetical protein